jgi:hypothetical protein
MQPVSAEQFAGMLRTFSDTAFRLETQPAYSTSPAEREALALFLAGAPRPPGEFPVWQSWLDDMIELTGQGKKISRVRIVDDPPTGYQRWAMWTTRWHLEAGEDIRYLPRATARTLGIPAGDWWLFDDTSLVLMTFTSDAQPDSKTLVTDPAVIRKHHTWRALATRHATTAETIAV